MSNLRENEAIKKLPEAIQSKLFNFIEKEIPKTKFFKPDGKPKKEWKIFYGATWDAARDAAWDAATRDAARDAAWDAAAWDAAAWDAAWDAARDAAWGAAWDAAWDAAARGAARDAAARGAAWDAAWGAARDAAWDAAARGAARGAAARGAAFQTYFIITDDLDYKDKAKHTKYAKDLWEIYQKGYGCICDVNGVFYVYAVDKAKVEKHKHVFKCECGKVKK